MPEDPWGDVTGMNRGYVLTLYERYLADPQSVDAAARALFARRAPPAWDGPTPAAAPGPGGGRVARAAALLRAVRETGHLYARLDPLATAPADPDPLRPERFGLNRGDLRAVGAEALADAGVRAPGRTALEAYERLMAVYALGPVGFEFAHLTDEGARAWLEEAVEAGAFGAAWEAADRADLLSLLTRAEGLERYLQSAFPGVKRFSLEGLDVLVPMLAALVDGAVAAGAKRVVIGMAHRGRLNVLAHVLGKPYADILADFDDRDPGRAAALAAAGLTGDVKYHKGWRRTVAAPGGGEAELVMCNNPSHLEFVDPVAKGMARSAQDERGRAGEPEVLPERALAVLVHGDAAFPGEGVVAETLNLGNLRGYSVGGAIHVIANNQIGFTTEAGEGRSTRYASDLAKGFGLPVVHVNADEPEAAVDAMRLAWAFRQRFGRGILVDLVGYRRWGHNEADEPAFTQPLMYARIRSHPTVRSLYADRLAGLGVVTPERAQAMAEEVAARLAQAKGEAPTPPAPVPARPPAELSPVTTERLGRIGEALLTWPADFLPHPRVARTLERRRDALTRPRGVDWGYAETLAFATLLEDGVPVRLSGQDSERGTFAQRHLVLHDTRDGRRYVPLAHLPTARASFAVHNSPLSEAAVMGFEYGYSVGAPDALVLWEAQYGDFANVAQVIVDQFVAAGRAKWGEACGLVLLLPHGYEGQGPEHSSARLERYLQLAAEGNMVVAYPTTAAQYFHLLRRQAATLGRDARPLVVMTAKSLLRHPLAASDGADLAGGRFLPVVDEGAPCGDPSRVERVVLASGKVAAEYVSARGREGGGECTALVRLEQLYPFPDAELAQVLDRYPDSAEVLWLQEEPANMGAWTYVMPRLAALLDGRAAPRYVGPPAHAAPAVGLGALHEAEMRRILREALAPPLSTPTQ